MIKSHTEDSWSYEFRLLELVQLLIDEGGSEIVHAVDAKGRTPLVLLMEEVYKTLKVSYTALL